MTDKQETWQSVHDRVLWWMHDMSFKPPELLSGARGEHYFECMAQDIADTAVDEELGALSAMDRLDP